MDLTGLDADPLPPPDGPPVGYRTFPTARLEVEVAGDSGLVSLTVDAGALAEGEALAHLAIQAVGVLAEKRLAWWSPPPDPGP